jgi:hypothetical protein
VLAWRLDSGRKHIRRGVTLLQTSKVHNYTPVRSSVYRSTRSKRQNQKHCTSDNFIDTNLNEDSLFTNNNTNIEDFLSSL